MIHEFQYRNGELFCEQVKVADVVKKAGTPLYLYSHTMIIDHFRKVRDAFAPVKPVVCFAMKANSNMAILKALAKAGAGFDVVSGGELKKVLKVGAEPKKIVFASVGKTVQEIETAVKTGILFFNVESAQELERIQDVCARLRKKQRVSLRMNPDVDPHTHSFITTGHKASKFGMDIRTVEGLLRRHREFPNLILGGLHIHIGSQILEARPFQQAIKKALAVIARARKNGVRIDTLNIGGGLGIIYKKETPQTAAQYAAKVLPLLKRSGLRVILEPGRFIVGNSGILLTRVLYLKESHSRQFAIVDAGMNDLIRPSLYGAYHEIRPISRNGTFSKKTRYDVVGPVCESGDFFAKNRPLPVLKSGAVLAVFGAGAYGFTMSSNYNSRPRAAEVLVKGASWYLIRQRERIEDLFRGEQIPSFLR